MLFLGALGAVLGTALMTIGNAARVECAANDVIAYARQILHTATANQHDRVLLQIVAFAGDIRGHFVAVRQTNTRHFAERGVRLLGRRGVNTRADAALLGIPLERRLLVSFFNRLPTSADQLVDYRHAVVSPNS